MFFKKKNKPKPEYKGIPVGLLRGFVFGTIIGYYCTNCYYGIHNYDDSLYKENKRCPKCNSLLDWDNIIDTKEKGIRHND